MKWRVVVELTGSDGTVPALQISADGNNTADGIVLLTSLKRTDATGGLLRVRLVSRDIHSRFTTERIDGILDIV